MSDSSPRRTARQGHPGNRDKGREFTRTVWRERPPRVTPALGTQVAAAHVGWDPGHTASTALHARPLGCRTPSPVRTRRPKTPASAPVPPCSEFPHQPLARTEAAPPPCAGPDGRPGLPTPAGPPRPRPHSPAASAGTASSSRAAHRAGARPAPWLQARGEARAARLIPAGRGRPRGGACRGADQGRGGGPGSRLLWAQPRGAGGPSQPGRGLWARVPPSPSTAAVALSHPSPSRGDGGRGDSSGVALGGLERGRFKFTVSRAVASLNPPFSPKGWEPSAESRRSAAGKRGVCA